jgi:hypothetical protein
LIPAFVLLSLVYLRVRLHFQVRAKTDAIRAAGLPSSGAELNRWLLPVEPSKNGALVITQSFALFKDLADKRLTPTTRARLLGTNGWSPEIRALVREYIQTNTSALALLHDGLKFDRFQYPVDYTDGFAALLPHLSKVKLAAVAMSLRTALAAEEGQADEWPELLQQQIKLGESLNEEPAVIGLMVRFACMQIAVNTAERSLRSSTPHISACRNLTAAFTRAADTNLLPRAFISERAIAIPLFRMSPQEWQRLAEEDDEEALEKPRPTGKSGESPSFMRLIGFFERDLNFYLATMDSAIALAQQTAPKKLTLNNHFQTAGKVSRRRFYIFSRIFLPALGKVAIKEATLQANLRMAATAFAIEGFHQTHGQLPADLKQLVPDFLETIPPDPYDGHPIRYTLLQPGYRLHSVGPDGIDNGGRAQPKNTRRSLPANHDLVFTADH